MSKIYFGNPIFEFLQLRGLSIMQFVKLTGLTVDVVYQVMEGIPASIPPRVMRELVLLGASEDRLRSAYSDYRVEERKKILEKIARPC